ncbi:MAG TPA: hypothetical protein VGQ52_13850 [Gemmatimonadaceae bacterium]|nr:hypothetical protein [Gemmatimonadaceae bacterium]
MLGDAIKARHFDFIVNHDYANTGIYRAHVELRPALQVRFSFQTDYATFTVDSDKGHEELPYVRFGELLAALDKILAHLPTPKMKKRSRTRRAHAGWRPAAQSTSKE